MTGAMRITRSFLLLLALLAAIPSAAAPQAGAAAPEAARPGYPVSRSTALDVW